MQASSDTFTSNAPILQKYLALDQKGSIMAEYIWIDSELQVRSKVRTLPAKEGGYVPDELPVVCFGLHVPRNMCSHALTGLFYSGTSMVREPPFFSLWHRRSPVQEVSELGTPDFPRFLRTQLSHCGRRDLVPAPRKTGFPLRRAQPLCVIHSIADSFALIRQLDRSSSW